VCIFLFLLQGSSGPRHAVCFHFIFSYNIIKS
jgi:hypothetical protein